MVEGETGTMSFLNELKRRNVFRVGIAYAVACWLLLQIVDLVLENINAPDWVMQVFMLALAVGFPIAIIVAWAFEVTPEGVKLQKNVDRSRSINRQTAHQLNRGIIMILSVAIVFLLTDRFRDQIFGAPDTTEIKSENTTITTGDVEIVDSTKSIAVLPFRDMSAAQDQAYFGEGIAEELLNALVKVDGLDVASRTSSFSLTGENLDIPGIAARLGVDHILEGSIRTSGQQVRVTAQLIDVSKDVHLWSETYDGSLEDIFKIQDEITGKITDALKLQLGGEVPPSTDVLTSNAEAYQLYLQGRHLWRQRSAASINEAIRLFNQAVELDPGFSRAWSNLAIAYLNQPDYDRSYDPEEGMERGLMAAEKALAITPQSSEALIIKANYNVDHCNVIESARLYETAIGLNPDDPTAHHWYAMLLSNAGRTALALEHIEKAKNIDPLISAVIAIEADIYKILGNYARAEVLTRAAASLGLYGGSLYPLGSIYLLSGDTEKGKALIEAGWTGEDPTQTVTRQLFLQALDDPEKQKLFEKHIGKAGNSYSYATSDNIRYLALLGSAYAFEYQSDAECVLIDTPVWFESFREQRQTPEFFEMMERAGMVEYWREFGWPDDCGSLDQTLAECP
jgi:TolB-like protein/Flp pilus assembly protein TadD